VKTTKKRSSRTPISPLTACFFLPSSFPLSVGFPLLLLLLVAGAAAALVTVAEPKNRSNRTETEKRRRNKIPSKNVKNKRPRGMHSLHYSQYYTAFSFLSLFLFTFPYFFLLLLVLLLVPLRPHGK
jgi:hypothetical protein